ncbi:hypothetical protein GUJ93_ZPchr0005g14299 [Zizania palustris]|uniref:Uncharacterized protein n=1 Tax=Zizania palustris TaxID=103762 RepID=A0A8J5W132_ZIZPA|nr:hypothetical protein GUJ93_ZPchr0005g14299 [Zizania palustris]
MLEGLGFRRARESTSNTARRALPCKALGRAQSIARPLVAPNPSLFETLPPLAPPAVRRHFPPMLLARSARVAVDADNAPCTGLARPPSGEERCGRGSERWASSTGWRR